MGNLRKWTWVFVAVAAGLAIASASAQGGFRKYFLLKQSVTQLQVKNAIAQQENAQLTREIEGLRRDPAAVEQAIREELGFIRPGEVILRLEPK